MKIYQLFDELDENFQTIDEQSFSEGNAVQVQNVRRKTFEKLGLRTKRRTLGKKFFGLTAAAVMVFCISMGMVVLAVNGTLSEIFAEIFAGEPDAAGLYQSKNVTFSSPDENLNVEVLGITADESYVYAMLEASYKDGSEFSEEGYEYGLYLPTGSFDEYGCLVKGTDRHNRPINNHAPGCFDTRYYLGEDRKTMKMYVKLHVDDIDAEGGSITVIGRKFVAQKVGNILKEFEHVSRDEYFKTVKMYREAGFNTNEYHFVKVGDKFCYCTTEEKEFELPYEITFSLDYSLKNNIRKTIEKDVLLDSDVKMTVSPFEISFTAIGHFPEIDSKNSMVILNDGTSYYLNQIDNQAHAIEKGELRSFLNLGYSPIPYNAVTDDIIIVDTAKIQKIIVNGNVLYEK